MDLKMYGDYIKERLGDEIIMREEGFATYRFIPDGDYGAVYIIDMYVRPDFRKTNIASEMIDEIIKYGQRVGCRRIYMTFVPSARGTTESLTAALKYGMQLDSAVQNVIILKKEI